MRLVTTFVALGLLLLFFFSTRFQVLEKGTRPPLPGHLKLLSGDSLDTASFYGKPLVLNFWATWCPPCRAELPAFVNAANRFGQSVNFVGIAADSPVSDIYAFQRAFKIPYSIVLADPNLLRAWKVEQFPITYFIDRSGQIHAAHLGAISEDELVQIINSMI